MILQAELIGGSDTSANDSSSNLSREESLVRETSLENLSEQLDHLPQLSNDLLDRPQLKQLYKATLSLEESVSEKHRSLQDIIDDSPFLDRDSPMTRYEWFKMVVLLPWTVLRTVIFIVCVIPVWSVVWLLSRGMEPGKPVWGPKATVIRSFLRFWAHVLLKVLYHFWSIKVTGREHMKTAERERCILVFNHVSYIDPILLVALFAPSTVAKAGVAKLPFFGTFAVGLQTVFIARKGFDSGNSKAVRGGGASILAERARDNRYPLVLVAPEGTTKPKRCMLRFSTGAFVSGQPVLPILLKYPCKHMNPGWGVMPAGWHIWRLIHQFANFVEVEVCPPYIPTFEETIDAKLYAENVRDMMATKLGVPTVNHGLPELVYLYKQGVSVDMTGKVVAPENAKTTMYHAGNPGRADHTLIEQKQSKDVDGTAPGHPLLMPRSMTASAQATCTLRYKQSAANKDGLCIPVANGSCIHTTANLHKQSGNSDSRCGKAGCIQSGVM